MQWRDTRIIWGPLLILGGLFFLLQNFGLVNFTATLWAMIWLAIFGLAGLGFLVVMVSDRQNWWTAIPGFTLLGLAGTVAVDVALPESSLGGTVFLGSIGLGFTVVYLLQQVNWWALIPGGVLITLAFVTLLNEVPGINEGAVLFLGMGVTFAVLALAPTPKGRMTWAFIPGAILLAIGLAIGFSIESVLGYVWPLLLILGGGALLWQQFKKQA